MKLRSVLLFGVLGGIASLLAAHATATCPGSPELDNKRNCRKCQRPSRVVPVFINYRSFAADYSPSTACGSCPSVAPPFCYYSGSFPAGDPRGASCSNNGWFDQVRRAVDMAMFQWNRTNAVRLYLHDSYPGVAPNLPGGTLCATGACTGVANAVVVKMESFCPAATLSSASYCGDSVSLNASADQPATSPWTADGKGWLGTATATASADIVGNLVHQFGRILGLGAETCGVKHGKGVFSYFNDACDGSPNSDSVMRVPWCGSTNSPGYDARAAQRYLWPSDVLTIRENYIFGGVPIDPPSDNLHVRTRHSTDGFRSEFTLSDPAAPPGSDFAASAVRPAIAAGGGQDAVAAWVQEQGYRCWPTSRGIVTARSPDAGGFYEASAILPGAATTSNGVALAFSSAAGLYVLAYVAEFESETEERKVKFSISATGQSGTWSTPVEVPGARTFAPPGLAIDPDTGRAIFAWADLFTGRICMKTASLGCGGACAWSATNCLSSTGTPASFHAQAFGGPALDCGPSFGTGVADCRVYYTHAEFGYSGCFWPSNGETAPTREARITYVDFFLDSDHRTTPGPNPQLVPRTAATTAAGLNAYYPWTAGSLAAIAASSLVCELQRPYGVSWLWGEPLASYASIMHGTIEDYGQGYARDATIFGTLQSGTPPSQAPMCAPGPGLNMDVWTLWHNGSTEPRKGFVEAGLGYSASWGEHKMIFVGP